MSRQPLLGGESKLPVLARASVPGTIFGERLQKRGSSSLPSGDIPQMPESDRASPEAGSPFLGRAAQMLSKKDERGGRGGGCSVCSDLRAGFPMRSECQDWGGEQDREETRGSPVATLGRRNRSFNLDEVKSWQQCSPPPTHTPAHKQECLHFPPSEGTEPGPFAPHFGVSLFPLLCQ